MKVNANIRRKPHHSTGEIGDENSTRCMVSAHSRCIPSQTKIDRNSREEVDQRIFIYPLDHTCAHTLLVVSSEDSPALGKKQHENNRVVS